MGAKTAVIVAIAVGSCGLAAPAAQAVPSRDLYMVKDLQYVDGFYIGEFAALRKKGAKVVGAYGAFNSEYVCIRGRVSYGRLKAIAYDQFGDPTTVNIKWQGSGSKQHMKGFAPVTRATASGYLGSDAKRFIIDCINST